MREAIDLVAEVLFARADDAPRGRAASAATCSASCRPGSRPSTCAGSASSSASVELGALLEEDLALVVDELAGRRLPTSIVADPAEERVAEDLDLLVARPLEARALRVLDVAGALVLLGALAGEDAGVDDDAADARRNLERAVADVAGLLAEDGAEQLLFGRELRLALRRDLADEDVARLHLGADADDAGLVEVLEGLFADVRDVARDLFLAELRVAGDALELLDVNRGEDVVLGDALGDEDRVLEVVALPRHERDEHVLAERELAHVGRRDRRRGRRPAFTTLAGANDRLLVVASRLVRALELGEVVDVRAPRALSPSARTTMRVASTLSTMPSRLATTQTPESRASSPSMPVPTSGA